MALEQPLPNQLLSQYCFLSPSDGHDRLVQDLDSAVLLYSMVPLPQLTRSQLCRILVERYGGSQQSWRIRRVPRGFLIYLPRWLYRDELNLDSHYWQQHHLLPQPWQALNGSNPLPTLQRVHLTILDFPIDYWHPYYFRQALASMGFVTGVHRDSSTGDDSTAVRLWLDTFDPGLIPFQLMVHHDEGWTTCQILMEGRLDGDHVAPPPPPPESPDLDERREDPQTTEPVLDGNPYIPPWRCRMIRTVIPPNDPSRRGAPAARLEEAGLFRGPSKSPLSTFHRGGDSHQHHH